MHNFTASNNTLNSLVRPSPAAAGDPDTSLYGYLTVGISIPGTLTCLFSIYLTVAAQNSATTAAHRMTTDSFHILFISLTVASVFVCGVTLPVSSYNLVTGGKSWFELPQRSVLCLLDAFLQLTAMDTALFTHGFIAVNRLLAAFTYPQRHPTGSKVLTVVFVVLSWLLPVILYAFPLFHVGGGFSYSHNTNRCTLVEHQHSLIYWHLTKVLHFFLPFALMTICYATILVRVMTSNRRVQQQDVRKMMPVVMLPISNSNSAHNHRIRKEIQVTKAVFLTCLTFILCYLPNTVSAILVELPQQIDAEPAMVTQMLVWFGCSFNPFIYLLINPQLRRRMRRSIGRFGLCSCQPEENTSAVNVIAVREALPRPGDELGDR
ncbi:hypothetical protein BV898_08025 [Hypsibius exemplaris]|uniref:G-protein coupled receptors family 1 profile domain-containing protein n=1 Tax=Hypsibius exemplaris TaxID=2072580 RepID=A0A1W0WRR2_HYPEX|nr:hypothetical protein BV898_08025 [Hypsibius exemplaris]